VPIRLEVITPERVVLTDDVDMVIAPASEGYVGILPHHTPMLTTLGPGELRVKKGGTEETLAIFGGFMDVRPDRVIVLTDAAEHAGDIDEARAQAARERAQRVLSEGVTGPDEARARAELSRALIRIRVSERRRRHAR
jgi:F-type H+-transporting ATPase subunit epsilon